MFDLTMLVVHIERYPVLAECLTSLDNQTSPIRKILILACGGSLEQEKQVAQASLKKTEYKILYSPQHFHNVLLYKIARPHIDTQYAGNIDGDCIFPPEIIEQTSALFAKKQDIYVGAGRWEGRSDGQYDSPPKQAHHLCGSYVVITKQNLDRLGGFNPFLISCGGYGDSNFFERADKLGLARRWPAAEYKHPWHDRDLKAYRDQLKLNIEITRQSTFDGRYWRYKDRVCDYLGGLDES